MNTNLDLGTILSVWAHPDDETYLAGGVMAAARDLGRRVVCVSATAGEHGTGDPTAWPPERLSRVRRWEAAAAMSVLGVHEHVVLSYEDGTLRPDDPTGIEAVAALIDEVRPDSILTFGADGATFHPDHVAIHHWVTGAWECRGRPGRLLYATATEDFLARHRDRFEEWGMYMSDERPVGVPAELVDVHLRLEGVGLDRKVTALRAMATQTGGLIAAIGEAAYLEQISEEAFVTA